MRTTMTTASTMTLVTPLILLLPQLMLLLSHEGCGQEECQDGGSYVYTTKYRGMIASLR